MRDMKIFSGIRLFGLSILSLSLVASCTKKSAQGDGEGANSTNTFQQEQVQSVDLRADFMNLPKHAKPRQFWWWLESNISKEGITKDLEAWKAKGFGGGLIFDAGSSSYKTAKRTEAGPPYLSDEWLGLFAHACSEADRLGLVLGINLTSGWNVGGPWVTPGYAAQKMVFSDTVISGGGTVEMQVPEPTGIIKDEEGNSIYYKEIAVLAYKNKPGMELPVRPKVSSSGGHANYPAQYIADGRSNSFWVADAKPADGKQVWLQLEYPEAKSYSRLFIQPRDNYGPKEVVVQYSTDGNEYKTLTTIEMEEKGAQLFDIPEVEAKSFRLMIKSNYMYDPNSNNPYALNPMVREVEFIASDQVKPLPIKNFGLKTLQSTPGYLEGSSVDWGTYIENFPGTEGEQDLMTENIIDLSDKMDASGKLVWDAPEGDWTILRFGASITGIEVSTSSTGWEGYMIDPLSKEATRKHFEQVAMPLIEAAGEHVGRSLLYMHDDSWEIGPVSWTPGFDRYFKEMNGYSLMEYLPVMAGKIVNSREQTNRFLYDFRRTVADLVALNRYEVFSGLCHKHGLGWHAESGGPHPAPIDALLNLSYNDMPAGEFWARSETHRVRDYQRIFVKQPATAAHIYGKNLAFAEGPTSIGPHWERSPYDLKPVFDRVFCEGLTMTYIHAYVHSPEKEGLPGIEYFAGTHMNRNITWWEQIDAFSGYIGRCQLMLQQGRFVADAIFYYGDNVPNQVPLKRMNPLDETGYDYDMCNTDIILNHMRVEDGKIKLKSGMEYRVLVLPERERFTLPVLEKLATLIEAGAVIIGPKPTADFSLRNFPERDEKLKALADEIWGNTEGKSSGENSYGKGKVVWGKEVTEVLAGLGVVPDFQYTAAADSAHIDYIHRRTEDGKDIYFVANRLEREESIICQFRTDKKVPELWNPEKAMIKELGLYSLGEDYLKLPLKLKPFQCVFIVIDGDKEAMHLTELQKDGVIYFNDKLKKVIDLPFQCVVKKDGKIEVSTKEAGYFTFYDNEGKDYGQEIERYPEAHTLGGQWSILFKDPWGEEKQLETTVLKSWTEFAEPFVKYFSGTATYTYEYEADKEMLGADRKLKLCLGEVGMLAQVSVNGQDCGTAWTEPYHVNITGKLKEGRNTIEIAVTNLWPNRLIGDVGKPEDQRKTRTNVIKFKAGDALIPSGLMGPVEITEVKVIQL